MMKKVLTMILMAAVLAVGFVSACAEEQKILKMGSSCDFPPYEYYDDETGEIVGIDVEIAQAIAAALGYKLEVVDMQFDSIINHVTTGKVHIGMSGFTITEDRKQNVDFSIPYTTAQQSVLVMKEGSKITRLDDLFDPETELNIGVQTGTTGDLYITGDVEEKGLKHSIDRFNKYSDAVMALQSGKIDCVIVDDQVAINFANAHENLTKLDTAYALEEYAACFAKGDPLREAFDAELQKLLDDGTVQQIIDKYISAE